MFRSPLPAALVSQLVTVVATVSLLAGEREANLNPVRLNPFRE